MAGPFEGIPAEFLGLMFELKKVADPWLGKLTPAQRDLLAATGRVAAHKIADHLRQPRQPPRPSKDAAFDADLQRALDLALLGFEPSARPDAGALKSAFRRRAKELHPDRGGSTPQMAELNAAYERLQAK